MFPYVSKEGLFRWMRGVEDKSLIMCHTRICEVVSTLCIQKSTFNMNTGTSSTSDDFFAMNWYGDIYDERGIEVLKAGVSFKHASSI